MDTIARVFPQQAQDKLENGAALLDVREYPPWVESHVPGATLIPVGDIKKHPHKGAGPGGVGFVPQMRLLQFA